MCIRDRIDGRASDAIALAVRVNVPIYVAEEVMEQAGMLPEAVSYTHLRAHETVLDLVCRLLLEKKT